MTKLNKNYLDGISYGEYSCQDFPEIPKMIKKEIKNFLKEDDFTVDIPLRNGKVKICLYDMFFTEMINFDADNIISERIRIMEEDNSDLEGLRLFSSFLEKMLKKTKKSIKKLETEGE